MPEEVVEHDGSVRALLASGFFSAAALIALATVLGKQVYDLTERELDLGLLGLAEFAPAAVLVLVTGSVADRADRRRVAFVAILGQAAAALGLVFYAASEPTAVGPIFGLVLVLGVFRAFAAPSTRALPADVLPAHRLPWFMPRRSATWQVAMIFGPVAGGFLYAADVRVAYAFVVAGELAAAIAILFVRPMDSRQASERTAPVPVRVDPFVADAEQAVDPMLGHPDDPAAGGTLHEAMAGLRFIRGHQVLLGAISLDLFAVLFGGAVALLPAIADQRLGVGAVGLGWLRAAGGIGAAAVTVYLALRPVQRRVGRTLMLSVAVFGIATIALGVTRNYAIAFIAMAILTGADSVSVFIRATLVPLVTPHDKRGRVLAVENVFIGASNELGAFESGVAGQALGPAGAVVLGGAATLAIAAGWTALFPDLRDVDRFPGSEDEPSVMPA